MIICPKDKLSDLARTCIVYDVFENLTSPVDCTNVFALVSSLRCTWRYGSSRHQQPRWDIGRGTPSSCWVAVSTARAAEQRRVDRLLVSQRK